MQPLKDNYPVFEANQVLTNAHLNQMFGYLDEQQRLTRANLIGIGIVCGLEIRLDEAPGTIFLSRGCGVTSEGYLIMEPDDLALVAYRTYELPADIDYPAFKNSATSQQYPLWELFPAGEPNTAPLADPAGFLDDKAVLLFLELKKAALRNCSPNNCNDKGSDVTVKVRRLLIGKADLDSIIANANDASGDLGPGDLEARLAAQLDLPDLRLPRFSVPDSQPVTSHDVLAAFLKIFSAGDLAAALGDALTRAYQAFQPILKKAYASDPFGGFMARFGFLDSAPASAEQVRFLPYYYDFFDDLIRAYDEFRWQGVDLLCACCPSEKLFPRHLMLGLLFPAGETDAPGYRHRFLPSAAIGDCERRTREVVLLFRRMAEMIDRFTHTPALPPVKPQLTHIPIDSQIRITPSRLGDVTLSEKAIPYYYQQTGEPPLYRLWNPEKTRRLRAHHNLSYRADEYVPAAPAFVAQPLAYDLEPYNFLRIEGHLGKNYQMVLNTLLSIKSSHRLPIQLIALRTGAFDDTAPIDVNKENCRFQDLETLYDVTREQLLCALIKSLTYFYHLPFDTDSPVKTPVKSQFAVINRYAPDFLVQTNTLGRAFEDYITQQGGVVPDIDANLMASWINIFPPGDMLVYYSFFYLIKLSDALPDDFADIDFDDVETRFSNLAIVVKAIEARREHGIANLDGNSAVLNWEEIDDRLEDLLNNCQPDALKALYDEYARRVRALKKKQFLGNFLPEHPGIQHKAGVPLGGTFILVYHQKPAAKTGPAAGLKAVVRRVEPFSAGIILPLHAHAANLRDFVFVRPEPAAAAPVRDAATRVAARADGGRMPADPDLLDAIKRLRFQQPSLINADLQRVLDDLSALIPDFPGTFGSPDFAGKADKIIAATVDDLADGTVIGDFYLPYLCCSDCAPIQFVLPKTPPTFTVAIGCTESDPAAPAAAVTITVKDGTPPYRIKIDEQDFQDLVNPVRLTAGEHTLVIQDAGDAVSAPQTVVIPEPLRLGEPEFKCSEDGQTYVATLSITGGTPPYTVNDAPLDGASYTSAPTASGASLLLRITDKRLCTVETILAHTCQLPCDLPDDGQSQRCAYRLWLQPAMDDGRYRSYKQTSRLKLRFNGQDLDLSGTDDLLQISVDDLNSDFKTALAAAAEKLNETVNKAINETFGELSRDRLTISYAPDESDPFGILWIEHFIKDAFSFTFEFSFSNSASSGNFSVRYGNDAIGAAPFDGAIFTNFDLDNKETRVPAFACSQRNQCTGSEFVSLCDGFDLKPDFVLNEEGDTRFIFAISEEMPTTGIAAWVWDFSTPTKEPFYVGEKIAIDWQPGGFIRLTAISDKGCFSSTLKDLR
ncbi:hypothetical protein [Methylobacter sp. BBA5.1]|uniref:hypothetical protein n=1 Tax=Methylobacter sp. BBA5.1 TaxID=1495064 RepID=UPI00056AFACE|nr:hypothetical protein [Methylobacter sp. BBA5.1]